MRSMSRRKFIQRVLGSLTIFSIPDVIKPRLLYAQPPPENLHDFQKIILAQTNLLDNRNGLLTLLANTQSINDESVQAAKDLLQVIILISNKQSQQRLIDNTNNKIESLNIEAINLTNSIINKFDSKNFEDCIALSNNFLELKNNPDANNIIILLCLTIIAGLSTKSVALLKNDNEQKQNTVKNCLLYIQSIQNPEKEQSTYFTFKRKNEHLQTFKQNPEKIPNQLKEAFEYSLSSTINKNPTEEAKQNTKIKKLIVGLKPNTKITIENIFSLRFTEITEKCRMPPRRRDDMTDPPMPICTEKLINHPEMQQNLSITVSKENNGTFPTSFIATSQWITSTERYPKIIYQEQERYKESEPVLMTGKDFSETLKAENKTEKLTVENKNGIAFLRSTSNAKSWEAEIKQLNENVLFKILSDEQDIWLYYQALKNIKKLEVHMNNALAQIV